MGYEISEGNKVIRDGELVATFTKDGTLTMIGGKEDFRLPAAKVVKEFLEDGSLPSGQVQVVEAEKIRTVRELVAAMQPYITEPCPPFSRFYGDKTPAVLEWIRKHDKIRVNILNERKKGE